MALNKSGNYKGGTFLKKIPGQGVKTHDIVRGVSFKDKAFKLGARAKAAGTKAGGKLARHYKRYVRPTTKIVRGVGRFARGAGKLALRFPGTGLAATGLYYGAKAIAKKGEKIAPRTAFKQYDKKGRWML